MFPVDDLNDNDMTPKEALMELTLIAMVIVAFLSVFYCLYVVFFEVKTADPYGRCMAEIVWSCIQQTWS